MASTGIPKWHETRSTLHLKLPLLTTIESPSSSLSGSPLNTPFSTDGDNLCASPLLLDTNVPAFWDTCVHYVIQERCQQTPQAPAVVAWDGSFTYAELDELSTRLASVLTCLGVKVETFVPICMNKSRWATVAIVAVIKAGAAFTLLDPAHPIQRLQTICQDLTASIILSCSAQRERCMQLANAIVVEHLCQAWYPSLQVAQPSKPVSSANAVYVAFTSGSTGKPKGVVIEHRAYTSGAREHLKVFQIDQTSRVLQLSSYAFDVCIMETLSTLMAGACLCVMQDAQRMDPGSFVESLNTLAVSHAMMTPSFARTVPWGKSSSLRTLILGGEAMRPSDASTYAEFGIRLVNAYGTAECSVNATAEPEVQPGGNPNRIGHPTGAIVWIVDPDDPERLIGPGMEGEMLLEGPIVGRGYLKNPESTRRAFIEPPGWLRDLRMGHYQHRLYRTGDLAMQDSTGALALLGRKEGQVKIRGQRIELGEIEQNIREVLPTAAEVIVEKVVNETDKRDSLIAFVHFQGNPVRDTVGYPPLEPRSLFLPPESVSIQRFAEAQKQLAHHLPTYMIPSIFVQVSSIPQTRSGKADRACLRVTAANLSRAELQAFTGATTLSRPPATRTEYKLQQVYAGVFGIPATNIGMDDNFVHLGGDSILALRLVGAARQAGFHITVRDLLGGTRLEEQALTETAVADDSSCVNYMPFSIVDTRFRAEAIRLAEDQCGVSAIDIEDMYPCTPLQEGMLAVSMNQPEMYSAQIVFEIPGDVSLARFREAWQATVDVSPILRTRVVQMHRGLLQVVVREKVTWTEYEGSEFMPIYPGSPLMRCSLLAGKFVLVVHHAVWDAWTMQLVHDQLELAFQDRGTGVSRPFHPFIQYLEGMDDGEVDNYWRSKLSDLEAPIFPSLPSFQYRPSPTASFRHAVGAIEIISQTHTMATYIHLAWSLLVSQYMDSPEAVYGLTVSGRNALLPTITELAGPTIATVPFHVHLVPDETVSSSLDQIQRTAIGMIPYEQAGIQRIGKVSPDAARACRFQSHLNIQVAGEEKIRLFPITHGTTGRGIDLTRFSSYALNLLVQLTPDNTTVTVDIAYDPKVLSRWDITRMAHQWEHILRQICRYPTMALGELDLVSPGDRYQLQTWNSSLPAADHRCLQDLVLAQATKQPHRLAVAAWDGEFDYRQLLALSSHLARRLSLLGVRCGSFVAVCMEKSRWTIVAILAILSAGGTCVLLDPSHPRQRMQDMVSSVSAEILVNAPSTARLTKALTTKELCMSLQFTNLLESDLLQSWPRLAKGDPDSLAFIIFTSGSTGKPKGIEMPHCTLSTSIRHHTAGMKVNADTRALHFSSYAFDVSIYEIFTTLAAGGCVCVPSEVERVNQLGEFIQRSAVNWSFMTPSTAQTLDPSKVPSLTTLVLGGEAVAQEHVDAWSASNRSLINGYGPAEATICAVGAIPAQGWRSGTIGHVVGGVGWITMPSDPSRLVAIGSIGELLLEGAFLARGYMNQPSITATSFIEPPQWRRDMNLPCDKWRMLLYRTGDLVQYQEDGSIRYIGRRDTQVKIRGQRVDLGEVETQAHRAVPAAADVVAETIKIQDATLLLAFIHCPGKVGADTLLSPTDSTFQHMISCMQTRLQSILPPYMVPSLFVPVSRMPKTVTGKTDRRLLREAVLAIPPHDLQSYRVVAHQATVPVSGDAQRCLQVLWSDLLRIPSETVGSNDTFVQHGGDSVLAMRLVAMARRKNFAFTVADVLTNCTLSDLAERTSEQPGTENAALEPPSTPVKVDTVTLRPATQAQTFLIQRYPWTHWRFTFKGEVDTERLRKACAQLGAAHSILRATFVQRAMDLPVAVLTNDKTIPLHTVITPDDLESYGQSLCNAEQEKEVLSAEPPTRFTLVSNRRSTAHTFILRLSHAQYDGICVPKIFADLEALYNGTGPIMSTDFSRYLDARHGSEHQHSMSFWQDYLAGSMSPCTAPFLAPSSTGTTPHAPSVTSVSQTLQYTALPPRITLATLVKAAACLVLAARTTRTDVVVCQTVNGRSSLALPQIDDLVGPCVNYIPFRVTLHPRMTVRDYLAHAQTQHSRSADHDAIDLDTVIKHCTDWPAPTEPRIILQHQDIHMDLSLTLGNNRCTSFASAGRLRPGSEVWICSTPCASAIKIEVVGSSRMVSAGAAQRMADDIVGVMRKLIDNVDGRFGDVGAVLWAP
ncbi:Nonribosomal peptide synthetase 13 [Aspergillus varians]